ncbi:hypothetical protein HDV06_004028 [Boothiomyces sp. JEL0866]|nr:hypothetical protein HDV06_004028 [Boothiomyces sp. JEL0866]
MQAVYLTRLIFQNLKKVTAQAKKVLYMAVTCIISIVLLDWIGIAIYVVQMLYPSIENNYYLGDINISINGFHSLIASYLFEQFKNMVQTQIKKEVEPNQKPSKKQKEYHSSSKVNITIH